MENKFREALKSGDWKTYFEDWVNPENFRVREDACGLSACVDLNKESEMENVEEEKRERLVDVLRDAYMYRELMKNKESEMENVNKMEKEKKALKEFGMFTLGAILYIDQS